MNPESHPVETSIDHQSDQLETIIPEEQLGASFLLEIARDWPNARPLSSPSLEPLSKWYRPIKELGQGGFGVVYLAVDLSLHRLVALKVARKEVLARPEWRKRFKREAITAASLDHPNIVAVYDAGEMDGTHYITCAYTPGIDLAAWLAAEAKPVEPREAAMLVTKLTQAVAYLHGRRLVHHDLKPANVLLSSSSSTLGAPADNQSSGHAALSTYVPKITDFGLSQFVNLKQERYVAGTASYMAPEQADPKSKVGPTADIFALGAILYELLTGTPFRTQGTKLAELGLADVRDPWATPAFQAVPLDLQAIVRRCLQYKASDRYQDASTLSNDLSRFLADEPVAYRTTRGVNWASPAQLVVIGLLLLAVTLFFVLTSEKIPAATLATHTLPAFDSGSYSIDIQQARDCLKRGDLPMGLEVLHRHAHAVYDRQREFTWGFLRRQLQLSLPATITNWRTFSTPIRGMTVSSDKQSVALLTQDGQCELLSTKTGSVLQTITGLRHPRASAIQPHGNLLAIACDGEPGQPASRVELYDRTSGKLVRVLTAEHRVICSLKFTPDGKQLAASMHSTRGLTAGEVRLWDAVEGVKLASLMDGDNGSGVLGALAISPDGKWLYAGTTEPAVEVWNLQTRKLRTKWYGLDFAVCRLAISADGHYLAGSSVMSINNKINQLDPHSNDPRILVWNTATDQIHATLAGHANANANTMTFSANDPSLLVSAASDGALILWNLEQGVPLLEQQGSFVAGYDSAFIDNDQTLLVAGQDKTIFAWRPPILESIGRGIREAWSIALAPDGKSLFVGADDVKNEGRQSLQQVDAQQGRQLLWSSDAHVGTISRIVFSPDGSSFYTCSLDQTLRRWDNTSKKQLWQVTAHSERGIRSLAISRDGKWLATGGKDGLVILWDALTGKETGRIVNERIHLIDSLNFHHRENWLAIGGPDGFMVWDYRKQVKVAEQHGIDEVYSLVFDPVRDWLYTGGNKPAIHVWNVRDNSLLRTLTTSTTAALAISADGCTLAAASWDGAIEFWYAPTGQGLLTWPSHTRALAALCFSKDGKTLYAASRKQGLVILRAE